MVSTKHRHLNLWSSRQLLLAMWVENLKYLSSGWIQTLKVSIKTWVKRTWVKHGTHHVGISRNGATPNHPMFVVFSIIYNILYIYIYIFKPSIWSIWGYPISGTPHHGVTYQLLLVKGVFSRQLLPDRAVLLLRLDHDVVSECFRWLGANTLDSFFYIKNHKDPQLIIEYNCNPYLVLHIPKHHVLVLLKVASTSLDYFVDFRPISLQFVQSSMVDGFGSTFSPTEVVYYF